MSFDEEVAQAYDESRLAINRRVEIVVTEAIVNDFAGMHVSLEERVPSNGR